MRIWFRSSITTEAPARPAEQRRAAPAPEASGPAPGRPPAAAGRWWWWALAAAAAVAAVVAAVILFRSTDTAVAPGAGGPRVAVVEQRDFVRSVRVHGTVEAVDSFTVAAPRLRGPGLNTLVITHLAAPGSRVERGDLLVEFDRQNQLQIALDRRAEYQDLEEQIRRMSAQHAAAEAADQTALEQAENALASAELDMRKNEILSRIDAEKNQQNLEEAGARLAQLRETLDLKQTARRAELRVLEIRRNRARAAMLHAERNAEGMAVHAPFPGLVVLNSIWKGGQMAEVVEGDEVRPGVPFLQVVNPDAMQVNARVNQADFPALAPGQPVQVRLDAYPELVFSGEVKSLAAIGSASGMNPKVRYFPTFFAIHTSHPQLLPDLSAAVDVELERVPDALVVPRHALYWEDGRPHLRVANGRGFDARVVELGPLSDHEAVIRAGVRAGEEVLLAPGGESRASTARRGGPGATVAGGNRP